MIDDVCNDYMQGSIPWQHRFKLSEFVGAKAFVLLPKEGHEEARRMTRECIGSIQEQLGFDESTDLANAVCILYTH